MNIKKFITPENAVKVGSLVFGLGSFLLANLKEKYDMQKLEANVVEKVMANLNDQNK